PCARERPQLQQGVRDSALTVHESPQREQADGVVAACHERGATERGRHSVEDADQAYRDEDEGQEIEDRTTQVRHVAQNDRPGEQHREVRAPKVHIRIAQGATVRRTPESTMPSDGPSVVIAAMMSMLRPSFSRGE